MPCVLNPIISTGEKSSHSTAKLVDIKSFATFSAFGYDRNKGKSKWGLGKMEQAYVYILTNHRKTVLYTGSTSDLKRRIYQHRGGFVEGFTKKYHVNRLVYFENLDNIKEAENRERAIKGMSRARKEELINKINEKWADLAEKGN
jgi:putative endonuclease